MKTTWILVAHGTSAKILAVEKNVPKIIKQFSHPRTGKKEAGNAEQSHAIDYGTGAEDHERQVFAREIIVFLNHALTQREYTDLILVASRDLMGELRQSCPETIKRVISHELSKDLIPQHLSDKELIEKIKNDLDLLHL
jgi:protein required for attachment to host cells